MNKYQLAAKELNDKIGFEPKIELSLSIDTLKEEIVSIYNDILTEEDLSLFSKETTKIFAELNLSKEEEADIPVENEPKEEVKVEKPKAKDKKKFSEKEAIKIIIGATGIDRPAEKKKNAKEKTYDRFMSIWDILKTKGKISIKSLVEESDKLYSDVRNQEKNYKQAQHCYRCLKPLLVYMGKIIVLDKDNIEVK